MTNPTFSIDQFKYQPENIESGTVYHYIKSNIDGSYPARIFIRLMDEENLDVWKFEEHNVDAAHVIAHMDWKMFSADKIESWIVTSDGNRRPQATLTSSKAEATFTVHWRDRANTIQVGHYPVHVYNFDFISLNLSLRYWARPEGEVTIGIIQPDFNPDPDTLMKYEGTISLCYAGDEDRHDTACRKYTLTGQVFENQQGFMWVDQSAGHIEDMEIPVPDNPAWDSFKFELVASSPMDVGTWNTFINSEIKKLNPVSD
jgi:hypothetical protein